MGSQGAHFVGASSIVPAEFGGREFRDPVIVWSSLVCVEADHHPAVNNVDQRSGQFLADHERDFRSGKRCRSVDAAGQFRPLPRHGRDACGTPAVNVQQPLDTLPGQARQLAQCLARLLQPPAPRQHRVVRAAFRQSSTEQLAGLVDDLLGQVAVGRQLATDY